MSTNSGNNVALFAWATLEIISGSMLHYIVMVTTGRTTRLILQALQKLSEGRNVIFVAHPREEAVRICKRAVAIAKGLGIPCSNVTGSDSDLPWVRPRAFADTSSIPHPALDACVFTDHSASHDRGCVREQRARSVDVMSNNFVEVGASNS